MKKDIASKWVKALRSGKFKQGRVLLKNRNKEYCCLGVLCEIMNFKCDPDDCILPLQLKDDLNMYSQCGHFRDGKFLPLAPLNDSGYSFDKIADIIEENWEAL
jgi:hypothetical protein